MFLNLFGWLGKPVAGNWYPSGPMLFGSFSLLNEARFCVHNKHGSRSPELHRLVIGGTRSAASGSPAGVSCGKQEGRFPHPCPLPMVVCLICRGCLLCGNLMGPHAFPVASLLEPSSRSSVVYAAWVSCANSFYTFVAISGASGIQKWRQ